MSRFATILTALSIVCWSTALTAQDLPKASAERMERRIKALAEFGKNADGGVDRVAYSEADKAGRSYVIDEMTDLGLEVRIDAGANILARRAGTDPTLKPIMFGSHTDSVPGGGNYDGPAGVIAALEAIELFNAAGIQTRHPLEVVVFSNEEGGLVGSLAITGKLKNSALDVVGSSGKTIRDGTRYIGGNPDALDTAVVSPGTYEAFIELHIEQGAFLDEAGIDIGVVEGIVGIGWWDVVIEGFANHAGTTPMNRRQDAMVAAAKLTLAVNEVATENAGRQVATVGRIQAFPGAPNVIPGRVEMSLEIRDLEQAKIDSVFALIEARAAMIAADTGTTIGFTYVDVASAPAPTDERMRELIAGSSRYLDYSYQHMPSGAGHDAQDMVHLAPTGMIFVPSVGGISHSPNEFTSSDALAKGADVLARTILAIDAGGLAEH